MGVTRLRCVRSRRRGTPCRGTAPAHLDFERSVDGLQRLVEEAGLTALHSEDLTWTWTVALDDLWRGVAGGVAGVGRTYLAQSPDVRAAAEREVRRAQPPRCRSSSTPGACCDCRQRRPTSWRPVSRRRPAAWAGPTWVPPCIGASSPRWLMTSPASTTTVTVVTRGPVACGRSRSPVAGQRRRSGRPGAVRPPRRGRAAPGPGRSGRDSCARGRRATCSDDA